MGDVASPLEGPAVFFDGVTARRRDATLRLGDALEICDGEASATRWPYDDVRRADGGPGVLRLSCRSAPELARLDVRDEAMKAALSRRCARLEGEGAASSGNVAKIVGWSLAAAVSIALIAIYGVPLAAERITALVPVALEARLGEAVANQVEAIFGAEACANPEGRAAFDKLFGGLAAQAGLARAATASVRNSAVANAFAIPGDRIYVLGALIDKARSPDELAGVLAHELGHAAHRDGLREMIASGGTAFLFGLLLGDVSGSGAIILASRTLLDASHSRAAEAAADAFAATTMRALGRSTAPLGEFLIRLTGEEKTGMIALLASHPLSQDRLAELKRQDQPATGAALLSDAEWKALKAICKAGR